MKFSNAYSLCGYASIALSFVLLCVGCVSTKSYDDQKETLIQTQLSLDNLQSELQSLSDENRQLVLDYQELRALFDESAELRLQSQLKIDTLMGQIDSLQRGFDSVVDHYVHKVEGATITMRADSNRLADERSKMKREVASLQARSAEVQRRMDSLDVSRRDASALLAKQERMLDHVGKSLRDNMQEVQVLHEDGVLYVSLDEKLLFPSGSWDITPAGEAEILKLAEALAKFSELTISVEGHTDDMNYRPAEGSEILDNWDLSVKRATSVVRILMKNEAISANPGRVVACGHSQYKPLVENSNNDNRATNRRMEFVLSLSQTQTKAILEKLLRQ